MFSGLVSEQTVKEQTLYEIQDPQNYFTPDVTADFSRVQIHQIGENKVSVSNASGKKPNGCFKTSAGYFDSYIADGQISYGGCNAAKRALLAKEVLEKRLEVTGIHPEEIRFDLIGLNSISQKEIEESALQMQPSEVRLRLAARTKSLQEAKSLVDEVETLYTNGPFGGGGVSKNIEKIISIASILIPVDHFHIKTAYLEANA